MTTIDKLKALYRALSTRQVGHTSLMMKGTDSYDRRFYMVGLNRTHASQIVSDNVDNAVIVTIEQLQERSAGETLPVAVDNCVIADLIDGALSEIFMREDLLSTRSDLINNLMKITEIYQDRSHAIEELSLEMLRCPWWKFRKLVMLEKRMHQMILSYNEDHALQKALDDLLEMTKTSKD
jgi:hypothetical protein